jgi:hypothetical protein
VRPSTMNIVVPSVCSCAAHPPANAPGGDDQIEL